MYLDEDLPAELVGRRKLLCVVVDWLGEQQISKHLLKVRGHVPLLDHTAVVLDGQDHRIPAQTQQQAGELKKSVLQNSNLQVVPLLKDDNGGGEVSVVLQW